MNADAILIIWVLCLAVAGVIVLAAVIRGDEAKRDKSRPEWLPTDMAEDVVEGLPEGLSDFELSEPPDEYDIARKNLADNPQVRKYYELDAKPAGWPGLAGLKARNRGKVKLIIEATDMTKNHNKEGTDGKTELHEG